MERLAKLLSQSRVGSQCLSPSRLAVAAWAGAVGPKISTHTRAIDLVRGRLIVEVEDAIWRRQLWTLRDQILRAVERALGPGVVEDLEFRIGIPRRRPTTAALDEAARIPDPLLGRIYRAKKRNATA